MKPFFIVRDVEFDTATVMAGYDSIRDSYGKPFKGFRVVNAGFASTLPANPLLTRHAGLHDHYIRLLKQFQLAEQPRLLVTHFGYPSSRLARDGSILFDASLLRLMRPSEMLAVFAQHLARVEYYHAETPPFPLTSDYVKTRAAKALGKETTVLLSDEILMDFHRALAASSYLFRHYSREGRAISGEQQNER